MSDATLVDRVMPDDSVPTHSIEEEEEYINYHLYEIFDNIGVPPGLDIAVFFPGHDCPHVNLIMPDDLHIGEGIKIRIPSAEPVPAVVHKVEIQKVSDLPYTNDRVVAEAFFVDCPSLIITRKMSNLMIDYEKTPPDIDEFTHKLNMLFDFFTTANHERYKEALENEKISELLMRVLCKCSSFKCDLTRLVQTRHGEEDNVRDVVQKIDDFEKNNRKIVLRKLGLGM